MGAIGCMDRNVTDAWREAPPPGIRTISRGVGGPECTPPTVPAAPALARRAISYAPPAGSRAFAAHRAIGCEKTRLPAGHRTCFPEVLFPKSRWLSRSAAPTWLVGLACVARVLF